MGSSNRIIRSKVISQGVSWDGVPSCKILVEIAKPSGIQRLDKAWQTTLCWWNITIFILNSFELIWNTHFGILLLPKSTIFRDTSRHHSMTCAALTDQRKEHGVELVDAQPEKWWDKQKKSDSNGRESVVSLEQDLHGFTVITLWQFFRCWFSSSLFVCKNH